jgi:hypothetical protein
MTNPDKKTEKAMRTLNFLKGIPIFIILYFLAANAVAQESDLNAFMNRASQYYLGAKDEILIKINIWGYVQKPGQYLVPRHTDLISLISFAGGPKEGANLSAVRIIHEGSDYSGNNGQKDKAPIVSVNVKNYLESGESRLIPTLQAGDTVLITQTFGNKFRNFLGVTSVVGLLAATATLIFAIDRL